jgi:hypothetical protein
MIEVNRLAARGDVLFRRIENLPSGVVERARHGTIIVAHSETGHPHGIDDPSVRFFEKLTRDPMVCFLSVDGDFADSCTLGLTTPTRRYGSRAAIGRFAASANGPPKAGGAWKTESVTPK